jgi:uncharacterized protein (DUF2384 family)
MSELLNLNNYESRPQPIPFEEQERLVRAAVVDILSIFHEDKAVGSTEQFMKSLADLRDFGTDEEIDYLLNVIDVLPRVMETPIDKTIASISDRSLRKEITGWPLELLRLTTRDPNESDKIYDTRLKMVIDYALEVFEGSENKVKAWMESYGTSRCRPLDYINTEKGTKIAMSKLSAIDDGIFS